jgi:hypothetical protein
MLAAVLGFDLYVIYADPSTTYPGGIMGGLIRKTGRTSILTAASVAVTVAISPAHPPIGIAAPEIIRSAHIPGIQLQAIVTDIAETAPTAAAATIAPRRTAAASPLAGLKLPTPQQVLVTLGTIAVAAGWYAAFPITLPTSFVLGAVFNVLVSGVSMQGPILDPVAIIKWSLGIFAGAPFLVAVTVLSALPAGGTSSRVTDPSTPSAAQHTKSGVASSRRTAGTSTNADRKPTAHRNAKTAPKASTEKKHSGTANSARPARPKG